MDIVNKVKQLLPRTENLNQLNLFKTKMSNIIYRRWPYSGLTVNLFGSAVNGLWSNKSDVDLCIFADRSGNYENMPTLARILKDEGMKEVVPIVRAVIPICKFTDPKTGFNCDISVNNRIPIYNSELIRCYMDLDARVRDIIMIVKEWAKRRGINNPKDH
ncbi:Nucleotidyltransferase, partial [Anaeromyces robustus]